ncbi:MAG: DUF2809 domain-containing protein [Lachnospiraceae bacterium]|nr:DUF2809 domain-containing protein [Lachnospiraceae bacterium]
MQKVRDTDTLKNRIRYIILFILLLGVEILIAIFAKGFVRGFIGDVIVIPTLYFLIRIVFAKDSVFSVYVLPFLCYYAGIAAEILQAIHINEILGINENSVLGIMIGRAFDFGDIAAYFIGMYVIGLFLAAESIVKTNRKWWYPLGIIIHWTWGNIQTVGGLVLYLWYIKSPHYYYKGVVRTAWPRNSGISLGMFIFTPWEPKAGDESKKAKERREYCEEVAVHEYGHTIQALLLGPLYIFVIGIPSLLWGNVPAFIKLRIEKKIPYTWLYCEKWASYWGEKVTKEKAIWN